MSGTSKRAPAAASLPTPAALSNVEHTVADRCSCSTLHSLLQAQAVVAPLVLAHHCRGCGGGEGMLYDVVPLLQTVACLRTVRGARAGMATAPNAAPQEAQEHRSCAFSPTCSHILVIRAHSRQVKPVGGRQRNLHPATATAAAAAEVDPTGALSCAGRTIAMRTDAHVYRHARVPAHQWYRPPCPASSSAGSPGSSTTASSGVLRRTGRGTAAL